MIELQRTTRAYGAKVAVDALELTIPAGELFAFLGPNGAGKTTTIKMLVGLLRPSSGSVRVCGFDLANDPREASLQIGYVPDQPYLYEKLTGREFLQFIADMYGLDRELAQQRVQREVERFELGEFADFLTESYSHGMKQRTVFASALLHDPAVLIVDEPMVGLDPHSARLVKNLLRGEARRGKAVFMSTHTLSVAEEIADRIGILHRGKLRFLGTVAQLRSESNAEHLALEELYLELMSQDPTADHQAASSAASTEPKR